MSDYTAHRPGGALKFKGEDKCVLVNLANGRKKKKKKATSTEKKETIAAAIENRYVEPVRERSRSGSASASPAPRKMTEAERRYEEVQKKRVGLRSGYD